jgi:hypothetical protein
VRGLAHGLSEWKIRTMSFPFASPVVGRLFAACSLSGLVTSLVFACAGERVTIEGEGDTGASRPVRDSDVGSDGSVADAATSFDSGTDSSAADAKADAPVVRDAEADASTVPTRLVIDEINATDILSKRYVEIAGPPAMLIGDLKLRIVSNTGVVLKTVDVAKTATEVMPARGTWVVGGIAELRVDTGYLVSEWDLPSDSGSVQLVRQGAGVTLLDVVGYGTPAAQAQSAPVETREGSAAVPPTTTGKALLRRPPHVDTGSNVADFCRGNASPNAANVCDP